jgi:hypothetical protein
VTRPTLTVAVVEQLAGRLADRKLKPPRELERGLEALARAPERARDRLLAALAEALPLGFAAPESGGPLAPAFPRASREVQARIALGEAPAAILRGLTPREAHEALSAGIEDPIEWILAEADLADHADKPRSVPVARWFVACWRDPARRAALERERNERGPGGLEIQGRLRDRIDEIAARDLPRGERTSVDAAFRSAAERRYAEWARGAERDETQLAPVPRWWRPIRCARMLNSSAALVREGRQMSHCVGSYAPAVRQQRSVIVSLYVCGHRSTAELTRDGSRVWQHKGPSNAAPHVLCERALQTCLKRWRSQ